MNVVILGCGRTGAMLGVQLRAQGHDVTVVERSQDALRRLPEDHGLRIVLGNGLDVDTMELAGMGSCDAFFALTRGDNTNLMAAQIVQRRYSVQRVVVKVADAQRAEAYKKLGLYCINASSILAGMCRDWLHGQEFQTVDVYNHAPTEMGS